jgi:hypothetical protein
MVLVIPSLAASAVEVGEGTIDLTGEDSPETARVRIDSTLPEGSWIAVGSHAPYFYAARFDVDGFGKMTDRSAER